MINHLKHVKVCFGIHCTLKQESNILKWVSQIQFKCTTTQVKYSLCPRCTHLPVQSHWHVIPSLRPYSTLSALIDIPIRLTIMYSIGTHSVCCYNIRVSYVAVISELYIMSMFVTPPRVYPEDPSLCHLTDSHSMTLRLHAFIAWKYWSDSREYVLLLFNIKWNKVPIIKTICI